MSEMAIGSTHSRGLFSEEVEHVADALEVSFKEVVAYHAGIPFAQTKVQAPNRDVWLRYAHAAIAAIDRWYPIESAPRDGTWIMVAAPNLHPCDAHWERVYDVSDWVDAAGPFATQPTHWRFLPAPPEGT